jgi:hypothetical protein
MSSTMSTTVQILGVFSLIATVLGLHWLMTVGARTLGKRGHIDYREAAPSPDMPFWARPWVVVAGATVFLLGMVALPQLYRYSRPAADKPAAEQVVPPTPSEVKRAPKTEMLVSGLHGVPMASARGEPRVSAMVAPTFERFTDTAMSGRPLAIPRPMPLSACVEICSRETGCVGLVYDSGICEFKAELGTRSAFKGAFAMIKRTAN